jgi:hypothetical protein
MFHEHLLAKTTRKILGDETADEVGVAPGRRSGSHAELSTEKDIDHKSMTTIGHVFINRGHDGTVPTDDDQACRS